MRLCFFIVSIFDLEDDVDRTSSKEMTLPLLELTQTPRQKLKQRSRSSGGSGSALPQSLSTLRPMSLPSPSGSRPVPPLDSSVTLSKEESALDSVISSPGPEAANHHLSPNEDDAMLKLVAAHTPSHRGLWDRDNGKALRMIMYEGDPKRIYASKSPIDSETASINDEMGWSTCENPTQRFTLTLRFLGWTSYEPPEDIARSLPVSIVTPFASKNPTKPERLRVPPELPLPLEPKVIIEESAEEEEDIELPNGEGRGLEQALRIIKARDKLPEPGMWRSLA